MAITGQRAARDPGRALAGTHRTTLRGQESLAALVFLLPNILGFMGFTALPVLAAFVLSFLDWDFLLGATFVGLDNYTQLLTRDTTFRRVVANTAVYVLGNVPINIILALVLALALNCRLRGTLFFRTVFFLPVVSTMVAVAIVWRWMYNTEFGVINYFLTLGGASKIPWLTSTEWPMLAIIVMSVWKGFGYSMVIFLAGLQGIPQQLYEAAAIDGANGWLKFWHITLPMLSPTTFFVVVITIIHSFQVFEQALVMTEGGPADATNTIVLYIYQTGFQFFRMGYAAAIAWILFAIIFAFTLLQARLQRDWVHYE
ncbi:MAG: sugar ABC transporter permease [Chloroflexota bacterium]|nr:MAG: sugar ABC transporter permease [Chloroflexota bacterium]